MMAVCNMQTGICDIVAAPDGPHAEGYKKIALKIAALLGEGEPVDDD